MTKRFKIVIEYDGTNYSGWQRQNDKRTVQGEIENALYKITSQKIIISGAGRTDAGVHAKNQVAHFDIKTDLKEINFLKGLNSLTPDDIVIKDVSIENDKFHSRFLVYKKTYLYSIINQETPIAINRKYLWHIEKKLDLEKMQEAANLIIGTHDFASFQKSGSSVKNSIRTIYKAEFKRNGNHIFFEICGNGFLRYMVRNLVGAFVSIGLNKISLEEFKTIFDSKDNKKNKECAPPYGLTLLNIDYKGDRTKCYPF